MLAAPAGRCKGARPVRAGRVPRAYEIYGYYNKVAIWPQLMRGLTIIKAMFTVQRTDNIEQHATCASRKCLLSGHDTLQWIGDTTIKSGQVSHMIQLKLSDLSNVLHTFLSKHAILS